jgi:uncharacterized protein (DUF1499 family)
MAAACVTSTVSFRLGGSGRNVLAPRQRQHRFRAARVSTDVVADARRRADEAVSEKPARGRREFFLNSSSVFVLGGLFGGMVDNSRPAGLGLHQYGDIVTLGLCPPKPNCVSSAEDLNDDSHFVPSWTYNPEERARNPVSQKEAMAELLDVVNNTDCDGFEVNIVTKLDDYLYVEYKDPRLGFIDDVEFFFEPGEFSRVAYRTAGRVESPNNAKTQRARIKTLRLALEKKKWKSVGF